MDRRARAQLELELRRDAHFKAQLEEAARSTGVFGGPPGGGGGRGGGRGGGGGGGRSFLYDERELGEEQQAPARAARDPSPEVWGHDMFEKTQAGGRDGRREGDGRRERDDRRGRGREEGRRR